MVRGSPFGDTDWQQRTAEQLGLDRHFAPVVAPGLLHQNQSKDFRPPFSTRSTAMPRFLRAMLVFVLVAGVFVGAWGYVNRQRLAWQWACYDVGSAGSYDEARRQLARFEQGSDVPERLRVLAGKWGDGNPRFDQHLARYATDGESSMALRQAFSTELGRRPDLLPRWAHYWCWQTPLAPSRQIASILTYLDTLAFNDGAPASEALTWREVLDLQAIFTISGDSGRAARVTPETWREHYRVWREASQPALENVPRPADPLPD